VLVIKLTKYDIETTYSQQPAKLLSLLLLYLTTCNIIVTHIDLVDYVYVHMNPVYVHKAIRLVSVGGGPPRRRCRSTGLRW
jgi:hypothetical protein